VILLVLVGLLWVAVLAPSAWRRFSERQGVGSIDHFHHQLQLLEHAGPKTVAPAYRLHTALPGHSGAEAPEATDSSRPKLVLLRPTDNAEAADVDDGDGAHYERVGVLDPPEPACLPEAGADLSAYRREQARRRCTTLLRCLCGVAISTGLIGLFPTMHLAWIFTALTGLAALALVGLIAYAKELEAEQQRRRARVGGPAGDAAIVRGGIGSATAEAGYPGAWDDDDEVVDVRVAAR
jgi:hypothetical protein